MVVLTEQETVRLLVDFSDWSGGFTPDECDQEQIDQYLATSAPSDLSVEGTKQAEAVKHTLYAIAGLN